MKQLLLLGLFFIVVLSACDEDEFINFKIEEITYITPTTAVISIRIDEISSGFSVWDIGIYVNTQGSPVSSGVHFIGGTNAAPGITYRTGISELEPNTIYTACAYVETDTENVYSDQISFTTESVEFLQDNRDGQDYMIKQIGLDTWMIENLNYYTENSIYFQNDSISYSDVFGRLYLYADAENVCPLGWHLPSRIEWANLINSVSNESEAGKEMKVPGAKFWKEENNSEVTNESWFSVLPSCYANNKNELTFSEEGYYAVFWAQSEDQMWAYGRLFSTLNYSVLEHNYGMDEGRLNSVRCVKD